MKKITSLYKIFTLLIISFALSCCGKMSGPSSVTPGIAPISSGVSIALLLPLDGAASGQAQAIKNGFFAAYYAAKGHSATVPTITVVNTSGQNITAAYQQAIRQGANVIVGPLLKNDVSQLIQSRNIPVPTLALNTVSDTRSVPNNLYQFGLSPTDEIVQAADRAAGDHHQNALLIAPSNAWGQNLANIFVQSWTAHGGKIVGQMFYSSQDLLADQIRSLLNASIPKNVPRSRHQKWSATAHRRQDADMIFLIANPNMARQIKPLLNYYFANDLPVYSTSQIYQGTPQPSLDRDIDGILFCDMPWVLRSSQFPIRQNIQTLWPNSFGSNAKLYALGVDAYNLTAYIASGRFPSSLSAATGTLSLDNQHHVYRQLLWAQMANGVPN